MTRDCNAFFDISSRRRSGAKGRITFIAFVSSIEHHQQALHTMNISRPSLEVLEQGKAVQAAKALHTKFQNVNLQLVNKVSELNSYKMDSDEELDLADNVRNKDPAIVAMDVAAQMV